MTAPDGSADEAAVTGQSEYGQPSRLMQVAAGVGIVAGVVFVVAVVFFSGVVVGASRDGYGYGGYGRYTGPMGPGGRMGFCPMMQPGGMMPGGMQPGGMMPGGMMSPTPSPSSSVPNTPHP